MAQDETVHRLNEEIVAITRLEEAKLIRRPEKWGEEFDLSNAGHSIRMAMRFAGDLSNLPLKDLPDAVADNMVGRLAEIGQILNRIDSYSVGDADTLPADFKNEVDIGLRDQLEMFLNEVGLWLVYLKVYSGDNDETRDEADVLREEMRQVVAEVRKQQGEAEAEIGRIFESLRRASGEAGVSVHARHFSEEVKQLRVPSWIWLAASGAFLVGLVVFLWTYAPDMLAVKGTEVAVAISTKVSIAAVLLTAALWCGRMYKAVEHRRAVNRHKELALQTFKTFVDATEVEQTKDAVLLAATNSIFDNVPTGLVDQKGSGKDHPAMQIVDFGKSLKPSKDQQT